MGVWSNIFIPSRTHGDPRGYAVLGLLCVMFVFSGIALAAIWGLEHYLMILSDVDLRESMQQAMQRITFSADHAMDIRLDQLDFVEKRVAFCLVSDEGERGWVSYFRNGSLLLPTIVRDDDAHPITGGHILSQIGVERMLVRQVKPGLYQVDIQARSNRSFHTYTIRTMFYIPADALRSRNGGEK